MERFYSARGGIAGMEHSHVDYAPEKRNVHISVKDFSKTAKGGKSPGRQETLDFAEYQEDCALALKLSCEEGVCLRILKRFSDGKFKEQLELFLNTLLLWDEIPILKSISKEEVFHRCLSEGPSFAKALKNLRYYSLQEQISMFSISHDEEVREWPGYDSFYHESNLIHWMEESEDFHWSFEETSTDDAFYAMLREELEDSLDQMQSPKEVSMVDVLLNLKNSGGFVPGLDKKISTYSELNLLGKLCKLPEKTNSLTGKRCLIQAMPAGVRDSSIPSPDSLIKIKHDSLLLSQIVEHMDGSAMTRSRLPKELKKSKRRCPHLLIDVKKCGLTFPRRFLKLLGNVLSDRGIFNYLSEYSNCYLKDGERSYQTRSGFFLGWSNEAPTILQCLILRIVKKRFPKVTAVIYNDDSDWVLDHLDDQELLAIRGFIRACYLSAGLLLSDKKEILSRASVFCEIYNGFESNFFGSSKKRQTAIRLLARVRSCRYKTLQLLFFQQALLWYDESVDNIFDDTLEYMGKTGAVKRHMLNIPTAFGGVTLQKRNGLDTAYEQFENLTNEQKSYCHKISSISSKLSRRKLFSMVEKLPKEKDIIDSQCKIENSAKTLMNRDIHAEKLAIESDNWELSRHFLYWADSIEERTELQLLTSSRAMRKDEILIFLKQLVENRSFRLVHDPGG